MEKGLSDVHTNLVTSFNPPNQAEQISSVNDEHFERLISEVEDYAIILLDPIGTIASWNKGAERIKGYRADEIVGKSFKLFYTKEDKDSGLPDMLLQKAISEGKANHEGWRVRKDGTRFWGSVTLTALHDDAGKVTRVLKVTRDLTERKIAEEKYNTYVEELRLKNEALKLSESRYHKMVSEVKEYAIILLDKDGNVLDWNKGAERLKGYKSSEIVGKNFRLFYQPEDQEAEVPRRLLEQAIAHGAVVSEGYRVKKDGSLFWASVTITALHDEKGGIIGFSKVTKDLTDRKKAEDMLSNYTAELKQTNEELRRSEERYQRMIAEVQDYAILLLSKEGIVQNWNSGAALLKGYSAHEIIGKSFKVFYSKEDLTSGLPEQLLATACAVGKAENEGWRVRKDGTKFWASVVITALHDNAGNIIGFSKVTRDLTERKIAEDRVRHDAQMLEKKNKRLSDLNEDLSSFAYIVSHDLKEPVRKIRIFSGRQQESNKSVEEILEYSRKIERSAERMQKLMEDLLRYSELSYNTEFSDIDLMQIVEAIKGDLEVVIMEKQADIYYNNLPIIQGIPHQVHQAFLNLINNSLKFAKPNENPKIRISCKNVSGNEFSSDVALRDKPFYEICFADNGIGFDQMHASRIFDVFQKLQSKFESSGSGIGLAIVKKVMLNHGGIVKAASESGQGATFKLYFPK